MRVITGTARGRKLLTPEGFDTRPTTDKVKEAICSALHFDFQGAKILDLFAGSGQMAIEGLSRGARSAVLIDSDPKAIECIQQNVKACGFGECATVLRTEAAAFLQRCREKFDIVFLDPPYHKELIPQMMPLLLPHLSEHAIIVCEHEPELKLPENIEKFYLQKDKKYGKITVSIYRTADEEDEERV